LLTRTAQISPVRYLSNTLWPDDGIGLNKVCSPRREELLEMINGIELFAYGDWHSAAGGQLKRDP